MPSVAQRMMRSSSSPGLYGEQGTSRQVMLERSTRALGVGTVMRVACNLSTRDAKGKAVQRAKRLLGGDRRWPPWLLREADKDAAADRSHDDVGVTDCKAITKAELLERKVGVDHWHVAKNKAG